MQPILVTTTCNKREDAGLIAKAVLENRCAACVHISGPIASSYWWQGTIQTDDEYLVTIKSTASLFTRLSRIVRDIHPYDVPELVAVELCSIDEAYQAWLVKELESEAK